MNFWSKGLGKKRIDLFLSRGESIEGKETLYVKGTMEAPVSWDYIIPMRGEDIKDFFALLKDPAMADYIYRSPDRWKLIWQMVWGGLRLGGFVTFAIVRAIFGQAATAELVDLQVPPPSVRKKAMDRSARRRRLSSKRLTATAADAKVADVDVEQDEPHTAEAS